MVDIRTAKSPLTANSLIDRMVGERLNNKSPAESRFKMGNKASAGKSLPSTFKTHNSVTKTAQAYATQNQNKNTATKAKTSREQPTKQPSIGTQLISQRRKM